MKENPRIFLQHIFDSIRDIEEYIQGLSRDNFWKDKKTQDAVMRKLEIVGEALKNLPAAFKKAAQRNRLAPNSGYARHSYS